MDHYKDKIKLNLTEQVFSTWIACAHPPFLIAGPCSVETENQLVTTARLLAQTGKVAVLRAGIWKPRTRPGAFEGVGSIGLEWLKRAKAETHLPTAVEVVNAKHVEEALAAGVDMLWIGSRSTVNPFTVQDIADALRGVDIPVLVKNPVNPDLSLWIGALERINHTGIDKLVGVHRGCSSFEKNIFRNEPMWSMAIQLKERCPALPIINDPSHICGNRHLIPYIAQKALHLGMDGLMIESHVNPTVAWTDRKQQLKPWDLADLIDSLRSHTATSKNLETVDQVMQWRQAVDEIDDQIDLKMTARMRLMQKIKQYDHSSCV